MVKIRLTNHAVFRTLHREINADEAKKIIKNGKVLKITEDGRIEKQGICSDGRKMTVIFKNGGKKGIIVITTYYEN